MNPFPKFRFSSEPFLEVGILHRQEVRFRLNAPYLVEGQPAEGEQTLTLEEGLLCWKGKHFRELLFEVTHPTASFTLHQVTIGKNFHWQKEETQTFHGSLKFIIEEEGATAINRLPVEQYLASVISSEMSATSSREFLKAHAVISRSWLLAQISQSRASTIAQAGTAPTISTEKVATVSEPTLIRWYDREQHTHFDVCADDHCQRYQGITRQTSVTVAEAIEATRGEVLTYQDTICDARFSKCCGGITERFETCWQEVPHPYLTVLADRPQAEEPLPDLTDEATAEAWIRKAPEAFCNTREVAILSEVLNDFDQQTTRFYRWQVHYTQTELSDLIHRRLGLEFGGIIDLQPVRRGPSGRLYELRIVGTRRTLIIGKELEIRRALSPSHLYSSAFVVEKEPLANGVPIGFTLLGAGWGHGVGLCQIGAAVMGAKGYTYRQILAHYYPQASLEELYR